MRDEFLSNVNTSFLNKIKSNLKKCKSFSFSVSFIKKAGLVLLEREIKEEFEMDIKAIRFLTNNVCKYPSKTIDLRLYECKHISGEFNLHDHSEYKWVNKEELLEYDLAPADIPLAEYVKKVK